MKKHSSDHIIVREQDLACVCKNCGAEQVSSEEPIAIEKWVKEMKKFARKHNNCKKGSEHANTV